MATLRRVIEENSINNRSLCGHEMSEKVIRLRDLYSLLERYDILDKSCK